MPGYVELTGIAVVAVVALVCGILMSRLRQPAIVGYILAGVLLGPSGFALVENREQVTLLAELGVLLLLFLIGMELSLRAFARVWRVALLGAGLQILISVAVMLVLSTVLGWSLSLAVLLGFVVALSSTAVAIKTLEDIGELRTEAGQTAVGVLIAQDLAIVPMLFIIGSLASEASFDVLTLVKIALAVGVLALMIRYLSRRQRVHLPLGRWVVAHADLAAPAALAYCFAAAAITGILGLTAAYGAFLAGLFIGNSHERAVIHRVTQPVQSVLIMVFFLSIGLLIDLGFIWDNLGTVILLLIVVTVLKTAMNIGVLRLLGEPWPRAFLAGVVLGQVGEFSFLLVAAGTAAAILGPDDGLLIVSVIALSLVFSPLWLVTARRIHNITSARFGELGPLLDEVYGREAQAVATTSSRAAMFGARLSQAIVPAVRRLVNRARRRPAEDDPSGTAAAPAASPLGAAVSNPPTSADPPTIDLTAEANESGDETPVGPKPRRARKKAPPKKKPRARKKPPAKGKNATR